MVSYSISGKQGKVELSIVTVDCVRIQSYHTPWASSEQEIVSKTRLKGVSISFHSIPGKSTMTLECWDSAGTGISSSISYVGGKVRVDLDHGLINFGSPFCLDSTRMRLWFAHRWVECSMWQTHLDVWRHKWVWDIWCCKTITVGGLDKQIRCVKIVGGLIPIDLKIHVSCCRYRWWIWNFDILTMFDACMYI